MKLRLYIAGTAAFLLAACGGNSESPGSSSDTPVPSPSPTIVAVSTATPRPAPRAGDRLPDYMVLDWKTAFSRHSVPYGEITPAGIRDGIPSIDSPTFYSVSDAPPYLADDEPVLSLDVNGEKKAYPLSILIKHEIVNDRIGGVPVAVTFCPLCNSAIVFDRTVDGVTLEFGVSGNLRFSDLLMWDRQTESWWQQITGEAIVGELTGSKLSFIPAPLVSWREFRVAFPGGKVLARDSDSGVNYDSPSYVGYDSPYSYPNLLNRPADVRMPSLVRVVGLTVADLDVAYPFPVLAQRPIYHDSVNGTELVVFFADGTLSPFPGPENTEKRVVGSTGVFLPVVDGESLEFRSKEGLIVDKQTGSTWNILGHAVDGPLTGADLEPVLHGNHFWFAWAAFKPDTLIRGDFEFPLIGD